MFEEYNHFTMHKEAVLNYLLNVNYSEIREIYKNTKKCLDYLQDFYKNRKFMNFYYQILYPKTL